MFSSFKYKIFFELFIISSELRDDSNCVELLVFECESSLFFEDMNINKSKLYQNFKDIRNIAYFNLL